MDQTNTSLFRKIDRTVQAHGLLSPGQTVVVAVSGGVDSIVLLDYLVSRRTSLGLSLIVAHLNHSLRGNESDGDEAFVSLLAQGYGVPFECRREDIVARAARTGLSLEEAGREARYAFFSDVARISGADVVAIAHHLDDQAETVLLRLIRGSGTTGLAGMSHRSADGRYIRPLLDVERSEIERFVTSRKLGFRTDSSNSDSSFLRNRVRLELLPLLTEYNPAIARRLAETAGIMAADEAILSAAIAKRWQEVGSSSDHEAVLDGEAVSKDSQGERLRLYRYAIELLVGNLRRISYRHLQGIDRLLLQGPPNGSLNLPGGLVVTRCYRVLTFSLQPLARDVPGELRIMAEGVYDLPSGGRVAVECCDGQVAASEDGRLELIVNLAELPFPWLVRSFLPGDRLEPRGMKGRKKVKDIFIDAKVPRPARQRIPLFFSGARLFWVAGLRKGGSVPQHIPERLAVRVRLLEFPPDAAMLA
ncbi:tRNA lysidine(34) synthetase TilS [Geobacter pelophilus]|uniref:tRNA(Ile)-lysidine synthase n=1 Tax=Geoanaerobacter pelophilus TaxID=60036 RepID=A0AAW4L4X0_9BACT|nr:tRNA lysidine(34) synthetase TilS [Geoanaerobacter pelophilus]MBT0664602.1 tRNA lysidine(34) synthetase TilS [Geoanaerobacter pelophilus]